MPDLDRLVPELAALVGRLEAAKANRYRIFRFEGSGAIKACFVFLRMDVALAAMDAETLALVQAVQTIVLWADRAFDATSPLARAEGGVILRPTSPLARAEEGVTLRTEIGAVIRVACDPVLPVVARDPGRALRLVARLALAGRGS